MSTGSSLAKASFSGGSREAAERIRAFLDGALFQAFSDPARREIVMLLGVEGELKAGEIAERFDLDRTTVSRHLALLRQAGLLKVRKSGRARLFSVEIDRIIGQLEGLVGTLNRHCRNGCS
jgi:ArsR family transcriptional regulator